MLHLFHIIIVYYLIILTMIFYYYESIVYVNKKLINIHVEYPRLINKI